VNAWLLKLGIYEQVVNEMIAAELQALSERWEAESAMFFGRFMGHLLVQVLELYGACQ
jgi:hypothetical protein